MADAVGSARGASSTREGRVGRVVVVGVVVAGSLPRALSVPVTCARRRPWGWPASKPCLAVWKLCWAAWKLSAMGASREAARLPSWRRRRPPPLPPRSRASAAGAPRMATAVGAMPTWGGAGQRRCAAQRVGVPRAGRAGGGTLGRQAGTRRWQAAGVAAPPHQAHQPTWRSPRLPLPSLASSAASVYGAAARAALSCDGPSSLCTRCQGRGRAGRRRLREAAWGCQAEFTQSWALRPRMCTTRAHLVFKQLAPAAKLHRLRGGGRGGHHRGLGLLRLLSLQVCRSHRQAHRQGRQSISHPVQAGWPWTGPERCQGRPKHRPGRQAQLPPRHAPAGACVRRSSQQPAWSAGRRPGWGGRSAAGLPGGKGRSSRDDSESACVSASAAPAAWAFLAYLWAGGGAALNRHSAHNLRHHTHNRRGGLLLQLAACQRAGTSIVRQLAGGRGGGAADCSGGSCRRAFVRLVQKCLADQARFKLGARGASGGASGSPECLVAPSKQAAPWAAPGAASPATQPRPPRSQQPAPLAITPAAVHARASRSSVLV